MLTILLGALETVMKAVESISFKQIGFFATVLIGISAFFEKVTGKKFIFKYIYHGIKREIEFRRKYLNSFDEIQGQLADIRKEVADIRKEVTYNGGESLKDEVANVKLTCQSTAATIRALDLGIRAADEVDNMMKFKMDATGYWLSMNQKLLDYFNFKESDVKGMEYENVIDKRDLQDFMVTRSRAINNQSNFICECALIDRFKKKHECVVRAIAMVDGGKLRGFYGTITPSLKQPQ